MSKGEGKSTNDFPAYGDRLPPVMVLVVLRALCFCYLPEQSWEGECCCPGISNTVGKASKKMDVTQQ